jgi:AraC-like DNA-binding protein
MKVLFHGSGQYPTGTIIGPRRWPHHDLLVVLRGRIALEFSGRVHDMAEGAAVLIPPHQYFSGEGRSADAVIWVLHFRDAGAAKRVRLFPHGTTGPFAAALLTEIAAVWNGSPRRREYLRSLAEALLTRVAEPTSIAEESGKHLRPEWEADEEPPKVSGLAKRAGFCDSHYRALFRKTFGETPRAHLRRARIEKARELLRETRMPIKDIAMRVGYGDTVAFHRAFTSMTRTTPARYRKASVPAA